MKTFRGILKKIGIGAWIVSISLFDLALMAVIALCAIFFYTYYTTPDADSLVERKVKETSVIYDRTGEHVLYKIHGEENRKVVPAENIPDALRNASISIEDQRFYDHIGFDVIGILRAVRENLEKQGAAQGGSTITQQLVRNVFLTREKTITRKFKELILSIKIERRFSKDEILNLYLNEVPYGSNAYGAEAAAEVYFGKPAKDLTLDEAALLAALPKATTYYSPYGAHVDALVARQQTILKSMKDQGMAQPEEIEQAQNTDTIAKIRPFVEDIQAPHFVFYVREQLEKIYGAEFLEQGGLQVYTTLDYDMQQRAEKMVKEYAVNLPRYGASNASLIALDPKSGGVLTMVGSIDYFNDAIDGKVNVSVQPRQPGSSFKPIVYAAAFEKGYQPETLLYDAVTSFGKDGSGTDYVPQNFDGGSHGQVSMRKAIQGSLNIPAVKTLYLVGVDQAIDFAEKLGITTLTERNRYGLSLVLGGGEVTLLDEVAAFSVFANDGTRAPAHGISRVIDPSGETYTLTPPTERVIDAEVARKIASVLSDNEARSYIFGRTNPLNIPGRTVAAKTGTTQEFRDAWTLGFTPSLTVGVWAGNNDATFMNSGSIGSTVSAPLWRQFMEAELADKPDEPFPPYNVVKSNKPLITGNNPQGDGDAIYYNIHTGKRISETKANNKDEGDVRVENSGGSHTILYYVNKDNPLDETLKPDLNDPMLWRWEAAIGNKSSSAPQ